MVSTKRLTWLLVAVAALLLVVRRGGLRRRRRQELERQATTRIKVGLVTDTGGVDDKGFNQFSIAGLDKAEGQSWASRRASTSRRRPTTTSRT